MLLHRSDGPANIVNSEKLMYILLLIGSRCLKFDLKLTKLN